MARLVFSSLAARKRRLTGTAAAVVLGVAFLAATLVTGDTARAAFQTIYTDVYAGTDAIVRSDTRLTGAEDVVPGTIDASVLDRVLAVDGVDRAIPQVEGIGQMIAPDGERIGGDGPPTLAGSWIDDPALETYRIADGRPPAGPGEVVIDRGSATGADLSIGDPVTILLPEPFEATITGIATFGEADSLAGITYAFFTPEQAQRLVLGSDELLTRVAVAATDGTSQDDLAARLDTALGPDAGVEVLTGSEFSDELFADLESDFLGFFTTALVAFAAIAVLVATFSIHNTLSIMAAQRTAETALLRAIGASRRQVLASGAAEALAVGIVGGVLGAAAGIGLAAALLALLEAADLGLPVGGMRIEAGTLLLATAVGIVTTVIGGVTPALRASRIAPLAALREAALDRSGRALVRAAVGAAVTATGAVLVVVSSGGTGGVRAAGLGALATVVGIVLLGPVVARPVAGALGAPMAMRGVTGTLARRNATRNPARTAGTASALLVGVGVVTLFTVLASSIATTIDQAVDDEFTGDLVVSGGGFSGAGLPAELAGTVTDLDEVDVAAGIGFGAAVVDGDHRSVSVVDGPAFDQVADVREVVGDVSDLADGGIAISENYAEEHGVGLGDTITALFVDGTEVPLDVAAVYAEVALAGDVMVPADTWAAHAPTSSVVDIFVDVADGTSLDEATTAVTEVTNPVGRPEVLDRDSFVERAAGPIRAALSIVYGLLAIAIIIALMGIANTLSLSVHERTRELGLLRAVGQSRRQLRGMVRAESVIVAVFGALGGLGIGIFLGWGVVRALATAEGLGTFTVPAGPLAIVLVVGATVGILAAIRPARRAAKLDVLAALNAVQSSGG